MIKKILFFTVIIISICVQANDNNIDIIDPDKSSIDESMDAETQETIKKSVDQITDILEKNVPVLIDPEVIDENKDEITLEKNKNQKIDYSGLRSVEFSESMAIIQKSILDKSQRIQWNLSAGLVTTETYYRVFSGMFDVTYHFNETYGIKLFYYHFSALARDEIKDLESKQSLNVQNLIHLKNYYGLSAYWNPIYGKMSLFNEKIFQYDTFFNLGAGTVNTKTSSNSVGVHFGLGNLFTLTDNSALRFDLNWIFYKAININAVEQNANSIVLTVGYSGFWLDGAKVGL